MYKFYLFTLFTVFLSNVVFAKTFSTCLNMHVISNPPIGIQSNDSMNKGVHWEYLEAIENESGICIKKVFYPYPRIWQSIERGQHDGGIVFSTPARGHLVEHVALIRNVQTVVLPIKGKKLQTYEDLSKFIIGKTRATQLNDRFDNDDNLTLVEVSNYRQAVDMLNLDRINAVAGSALVLSYNLFTSNTLNKLDLDEKFVLGSREQWLQISKKSNHLDKIPKLRQAVKTLHENGTFDRIMLKYYGTNWKKINNN